MIQGVIFDLGETLIRFEGTWETTIQESQEALSKALEAKGFHIDLTSFHDMWHAEMQAAYQARDEDETERPSRDLLAGVLARYGFPDVDQATIDYCLKAMYEASEREWLPIPESHGVLDALRGSYRLGMISNAGDAANVDRLIDKGGFRTYFDPILISASLRIRKPSPKPFELVMEQWGVPAEDVVMIGDTLRADILGAQRVGMHQIWLTGQADRADNVEAAKSILPEMSASSLTEVTELIRSLDHADGRDAH